MDATPSSVALSSTDQGMDDGDCMDVMESFGCIDLFDNNEIWDPTPLFEGGEGGGDDGSHQGCFDAVGFLQQDQDQSQIHSPLLDQAVDHNHHQQQQQQQQQMVLQENALADQGRRFTTIDDDDDDDDDDGSCRESPISEKSSEDIGMVFLEWLKSNKESISAEDLRSIRIKKSTIECAERRLGGGQEGMTRLLKLVLQWVQNHHLQNRRMRSEIATTNNIPNCQTEQSPPNPDPSSLNPNLINPCFSSPRWPPLPPYITDPAAMTPLPQLPSFPQMVGYMGGGADPNYANGANSLSSCSLQPADHRMLETSPSWPPPAPPHFGMPPPYYNPLPESSVPLVAPQLHAFTGYGNQYGNYPFSAACQGQGDGLMRLGASATKEARKKRMARQRRFFSHHHRTQNHQNGNPAANQMMEMVVDDVCVGGAAQANHNWMYNWQPAAAAGAASPSAQGQIPNIDVPVAQGNSSQKQALVEKQQQQQQQQQAWKTEKNLRFLLQKVLKQSDVGNLGRIVLPKKEAETHLPELEARDGITIPMEDIGTSRVWHMRYRFWPNNKSRMYLLENTGEFVRSNGLQEGDFIVIYSDVKCGKYMIRGVKVRPQQGPISEPKKLAKTHKSRGN
ncbi:B3 domain-containing transcription factor [Dionaea muscipula]